MLRKAYEAGIDFYDTARFYTDSEEKIGEALSDVRDNIYIATKTAAQNSEDFWKDLATSLNNLKTDYIDIYQFHGRTPAITSLTPAIFPIALALLSLSPVIITT